jgi:predicted GTPase
MIDTLTGEQGQRAGESFTSVTKDLEASRILDHDRYGSRIVLLDTPGFDDTERTDEQILGLIGEWLQTTYGRIKPSCPVLSQ